MTKRELINRLESIELSDDCLVYFETANELLAVDINSATADFIFGSDEKFIILSDMAEG